MSVDRLPWFPLYTTPWLEAFGGMKPTEKLVYVIVVFRIYESGGICRDTLDAIATRVGWNKRIVSEALASLFRSGRLIRNSDGISNPKADAVIADAKARHERRASAGQKGGLRKAKNMQQKQRKHPSNAEAMLKQKQLHLQEEDSLFSKEENSGAEAPPEVMVNPPLDASADYYRRVREVLGQNAGAMATKLLRAKGGNVALARAAIEQASTRGDARQYVGAMVRDNAGEFYGKVSARNTGFGFAELALRLKAEKHGAGAFSEEGRRASASYGPSRGRGDSTSTVERMAGDGQAALPSPRANR